MVATCVQLIQAAWGSLDGLTTFEDARSYRETMKVYSKLAEAGTEVTLQALNSEYMKIKSNHRGVYDSQKDQLRVGKVDCVRLVTWLELRLSHSTGAGC